MGTEIQALRVWREREGWTQEQLAVYAGVSALTVRKIEKRYAGYGGPAANTRRKLADALGVGVAQIEEFRVDDDDAKRDPEYHRTGLAG